MSFMSPVGFQMRPQSILDVVDEESLKTVEGKKKYLDFLESNPEITPIQKLYGFTMIESVDSQAIEARVKRLSLYIHPDRNPDSVALCTRLIQIVNAAATALRGESRDSAFVDPIELEECIELDKWSEAKKLVDGFTPNDYSDHPSLCVLASIVFFRLGMLQPALDYLNPSMDNIKRVLQRFSSIREGSYQSPKDREMALRDSLRELEELGRLRAEHPDFSIEQRMLGYIVPHYIYVNLKECLPVHDIEYERCLRLAIRLCPSILQEEKQALISELEQLISSYYGPKTSNVEAALNEELVIRGKKICNDLIGELNSQDSLGLSHTDKRSLECALKEFEDKMDVRMLDTTLLQLEESINASSSKRFGFSFGSHQYSEATKVNMEKKINLLRGITFYLQGNVTKSAHHFLLAEENYCLAIVQFKLHEYDRAIDSWGKCLKSAGKESQICIMKYIFDTMNFHDTMYVAEASLFQMRCLKAVDEVQLRVLHKMRQIHQPSSRVRVLEDSMHVDDNYQRGFDKGKAEGIKEGKLMCAVKLLNRGRPIEEIAEDTGLSVQEIGSLR